MKKRFTGKVLKPGFLMLVVLFAGFSGYAQELKIRGLVTDNSELSLPGVSIMIKGTNIGTVTDIDGNYSINVSDENAVLVFSFIGYATQEVPVEGRSVIDVSMNEDVQSLDEVVVIGYGTAKKSDLTGAVTRIDAKSFESQPMTQLTEMLTGTVAGFNADQGTSASGGSSMQIRGPKSLNASTSPMIVLDGVIYNGSISDINPADIQSIDVLKDASSAAVYGARAAAGVVIVTTKKGKQGKPLINFSTNVGITEVTNDFKPYDADGYLQFRKDVLRSYYPDKPSYFYDNPNQLPGGVTIEEWRNASNNAQSDNTREWLSRLNFFPTETENYLSGKTEDWYNEVIRKGIRQNYDLSISGGSDNITYYWSVGYQNNEGVVRGDEFSTVRSRLNVDFKVADWLNVGVNTQFADRDESSVLASLGGMYVNSPYGSMYEEDGNLKWYPNDFTVQNPLLNYFGQDKSRKINTFFSSLYTNIDLPFGISYKLSFQPRYEFLKDYDFWSSKTIVGGSSYSQGYGSRDEYSSYEWIVDNILKWKKEFGIHQFDVTLLYSSEQAQNSSSFLSNESFLPNENLGFYGLQYGTNPAVNTYNAIQTGDAVMGRINYTLLSKYLFTASVRRDGYSAFGQKEPRATFPAAAFAWRVSEEEFFNVNWIDHMKFRLSWGVNGNRDIGAYSALAQVAPDLFYDGNDVAIGVYNTSLSNAGLSWERTESINIGLDFGLFKNRVDVSAEYYDMTTTNLLMNRLLPKITGFSNVTTNLGELGNRGFELTLNTVNMDKPDIRWKSGLVLGLNRNKIKKLFGDYEEIEVNGETIKQEVPDYSNEWFPGQAIDVVWNYEVLGIWQNGEGEAASYGLQPGDFKVRDVNENGTYDELADKQFIGHTQPRYRLGFRNNIDFLKNFSLSLFIRADLGHLKAFPEALRRGGSDTYDRRNTYDIPYWTPENSNNEYARLNTNTTPFGGGIMIYKPASFVRIQDLSLSYALPESLIEKLQLNNVRIFGSVRNLYSFDNWPGWDPESKKPEPMPRNYAVGVNLSL
jgi:TonB-linked SusC/RagA family outer membrane protein